MVQPRPAGRCRLGINAARVPLRPEAVLKSGEFRPQPVRERRIPKPGGSGKVRRPEERLHQPQHTLQMMRTRHRWRWKDVRRWLTDRNGLWRPITADGIEMFNPAAVPITRYRYRSSKIPNPWASAL